MIIHYDRQGKPLKRDDWLRLFEDREYRTVACHEDERVLISTVWLGLDHNWAGGPPLIFETMVFIQDKDSIDPKYDQLQWRWHTEEEAKEMHELIVNCYRENKDPKEAVAATIWQHERNRHRK